MTHQSFFHELMAALKYLVLVALLAWLPLVVWVIGIHPLDLFDHARAWLAALIFTTGALIANATAVGGGLVFNPSFQMVFQLNGFTALVLAILVQCWGMTSGTYGWYKKSAFTKAPPPLLWRMSAATMAATAVWSLVFLALMQWFDVGLLIVMRLAGMFVSFYVFWLVMKSIREREQHVEQLKKKAHKGDVNGLLKEVELLEHIDAGDEGEHGTRRLWVDRRIYFWIASGSLLNVTTAVGVGELVFSHLIKYYDTPPRVAIAVGTLLQAVSVLTQAIFILLFMREYIPVELVCIGMLFCVIGGRFAPLVMTRRQIEPFAKQILAYTALGMGLTTAFLLIRFLTGL